VDRRSDLSKPAQSSGELSRRRAARATAEVGKLCGRPAPTAGPAVSGHEQPVEPRQDRSAARRAADTLNRTVRSLLTPPEREFFKAALLCVPSNTLSCLDFDIRTKMAVVRLLRRKWAERDKKRPEMALRPVPMVRIICREWPQSAVVSLDVV
jgi:hypothetical protein